METLIWLVLAVIAVLIWTYQREKEEEIPAGYIPEEWRIMTMLGSEYKSLILKHASSYGISPAYIMATIHCESSFRPDMIEEKDGKIISVGIGQVNPEAWKDFLKLPEDSDERIKFLLDPENNIICVCKIWVYFLDKWGDKLQPADIAEIYPLGETKYFKGGKRYPSYRERWINVYEMYSKNL